MLAICVPVRDTVHTGFAYCLAQLTAKLTKDNVEYKLFFENGSLIADQRYRLAKLAVESACDRILWLDSDMIFPASTFNELAAHSKSVVACTYSTRTRPYRNVAFVSDDLKDTLTATTGLHPVHSVGMGIVLTDINVFKTTPAPWFSTQWSYKHETFIGEDMYFFSTLHEYDIDVFVDVDLSNRCAHQGTTSIKLEDINV